MAQARKYPTPHINATPYDFAKTVLMPGDPLRAKFIAEAFLEGAKLINDVRGIHGYTGRYMGKDVSVMASGMGMPSMGIYSYELFNFFEVENIIRVGSVGGIADNLNLRDIVFAMGSSTDSNYANQYCLSGTFAPIADFNLLSLASAEAKAIGARYHVGNVLTTDAFYSDNNESIEGWYKMGILGVEMESAALYMNAARARAHALAILTVSDHVRRGEALDSESREKSFTQMIEIALNTALKL